MRGVPALVCLIVSLFVSVASLSSQAQPATPWGTGEIHGTVTDVSSAVIPGATATLEGPLQRQIVSDEHGRFVFRALPPGAYVVTVSLAGFVTERRAVGVLSDQRVEVAVALTVGALTETITVSGSSPGIDASRSGGRFGEEYEHLPGNGFRRVANAPRSTFSVDVDTASYANVRRFLRDGALPPPGAVRVEELVNYFRFDYAEPKGRAPFGVTTEYTLCPWNPRHRLALIGLQGRRVTSAALPPRNLVFLIDVSGSMADADKLPLVRQALRLFTAELTARDRVSVVVYAGASGLALPSTRGDDQATIHRALAELEAGGSTNGGDGLMLAYREARAHFIDGGVNRVILATDGDFNVGVTGREALVQLIEREREAGVFLSVLGVGQGNLKDATMESLADKGNGNYSYLDSLHEARKVLMEEGGGTLVTIAKDVKIQVEFNPAVVAAYRLVGYENRLLQDEDFTDDRKDAGEIGAGHSVTALYEIVPVGTELPLPRLEPLRYQNTPVDRPMLANEVMTVNIRYKAPDGDRSHPLVVPVASRVTSMGNNAGFASAVAEFALVLRGAAAGERVSFRNAAERARRYRGVDPHGYRAEFVQLVGLADGLQRLVAP